MTLRHYEDFPLDEHYFREISFNHRSMQEHNKVGVVYSGSYDNSWDMSVDGLGADWFTISTTDPRWEKLYTMMCLMGVRRGSTNLPVLILTPEEYAAIVEGA